MSAAATTRDRMEQAREQLQIEYLADCRRRIANAAAAGQSFTACEERMRYDVAAALVRDGYTVTPPHGWQECWRVSWNDVDKKTPSSRPIGTLT